MEKISVINIEWEKVQFDFNEIKNMNRVFDYGLYQVYGQHPAYGHDALLYIGKAQDQKFSIRLNQRWEFIESSARPTCFRLGRIVGPNDSKEDLGWESNRWDEIISISEKILIKAHSPAHNKQENTGVFSHDAREFNYIHYMINNWGDYGQLLPEVSTLRFSYKYWNFETPIGYKK